MFNRHMYHNLDFCTVLNNLIVEGQLSSRLASRCEKVAVESST